jgi:hypothetical protein
MSSLIRQSHASNDQPLWASASQDDPSAVNATAYNLVTTSQTPTGARITSDNTTNGIMLLQGDRFRFAKGGQTTANTEIVNSAVGAGLDVMNVGGVITTSGVVGSQGLRLKNEQYISFTDEPSVPVVEGLRIYSAETGTPGLTFSSIAVQPTASLYFNQIGQSANSSIKPGPFSATNPQDELVIGGSIQTNRLSLNNVTGAEVHGVATLAAGEVTVTTSASDVNAIILLTRTAVNASTTLGELRVRQKNVGNFIITSATIGTPGTPEAGDLSDVQWVILNPV